MNAELLLSMESGAPMYQQIMDQIAARVMAGDWQAGQALPSIRELASLSKVSVITVKRAYMELERAGVIVTQQGKGSFVASTQDLPKALMHTELQQRFDALFASAEKLGLSHAQLLAAFQERLALSKVNTENQV